jgi:hypothetical protein
MIIRLPKRLMAKNRHRLFVPTAGFSLAICDIFIPMLSAMRRLSFTTMQSTDDDHSIPFTSIIGACMLRE